MDVVGAMRLVMTLSVNQNLHTSRIALVLERPRVGEDS
jgi:hypothetical protein